MDSTLIAALIELAKIGLNSYFSLARLAGKTDAEIDAMFLDERRRFKANAPETLPDIDDSPEVVGDPPKMPPVMPSEKELE